MQAGTQGEALRQIADRLCVELADPDLTEAPGARPTLAEEGGMTGILGAEDEALVRRLREVLARIAATVNVEFQEPPIRVIEIALDGAEFVIRGELAAGNTDRVLRLMPSFVFLVALSVADQDRALELSRRAAEVID